ncbi:MAG: hypothetical protein E7612_04315 [Ruminococcaceae bacterium]|nr:hypothetical protein [Oscillospiraceae bacterium]
MDDWRLNGQDSYLFRVKLFKKAFKACGYHDHDHCDFCWDKFSEHEDDLQFGYCTQDEHHWVCETCYNDFNHLFEWDVEIE